MPVKILLADKSITIQKVVEMLFSGRDYEVTCVSDGETALSEAERAVPDVVLVDVDLPRVDGYSFADTIRKIPALAQTPVILMMSRDDVYDSVKGKQSGVADNIAKPFESQDLFLQIEKALENRGLTFEIQRLKTLLEERRDGQDGHCNAMEQVLPETGIGDFLE